MWTTVSNRLVIAAAALSLAFAAGWYVNGLRLNGKHNAEIKAMYEAGRKVAAERREKIQELKGKSREDAIRIAKLSRNARVRVCPPASTGLPGTAGSVDAGTAGNSGEVGEDITDLLRQCLRTFGEVNRVLEQ